MLTAFQVDSSPFAQFISVLYNDITLKTAKNLSIGPVMGDNPTIISHWFSLLQDIKKKCDILSPCQIWSGDETRIQNVPKEVKVLGAKKILHFNKSVGGQGETSRILTFINTTSQAVPPLVCHKGQCVQDTWHQKAPGQMKVLSNRKRIHNENQILRVWFEF